MTPKADPLEALGGSQWNAVLGSSVPQSILKLECSYLSHKALQRELPITYGCIRTERQYTDRPEAVPAAGPEEHGQDQSRPERARKAGAVRAEAARADELHQRPLREASHSGTPCVEQQSSGTS